MYVALCLLTGVSCFSFFFGIQLVAGQRELWKFHCRCCRFYEGWVTKDAHGSYMIKVYTPFDDAKCSHGSNKYKRNGCRGAWANVLFLLVALPKTGMLNLNGLFFWHSTQTENGDPTHAAIVLLHPNCQLWLVISPIVACPRWRSCWYCWHLVSWNKTSNYQSILYHIISKLLHLVIFLIDTSC